MKKVLRETSASQLDVGKALRFELELLFKRLNALAGFHRSGAGYSADQGFLARLFVLLRRGRLGHEADRLRLQLANTYRS